MTKKENAIQILRFGKPEYNMNTMPMHNICYTGCNHDGYNMSYDDCSLGEKWVDVWGVHWEKKQEGIMGYPISHPLEDINELKNYNWPDPNDPRIYKKIYEMAEQRTDSDCFLCGSHRNLLLEKAESLIGMENLFIYFYTEPELLREFFRKYMDFQIKIAEHYISLGVEMITCSEDMGTQNSLLISLELINDFLVPEYKRLFSLYKQHGVIIEFHSCGHIEPFIETLIDLGVDILNPVQATANNLENVRKITQNRMALHGGVNSDTILNGPIEAIKDEIKLRIEALGAKGGYFCDADQHMNFPPENIRTFYESVRQFGK